jgi:hypothetical protein
MEDVWLRIKLGPNVIKRLFTRENLTALLLALLILIIIILSTDTDPQWIYQGF